MFIITRMPLHHVLTGGTSAFFAPAVMDDTVFPKGCHIFGCNNRVH